MFTSFKYAFRGFLRTPGFTVTALLTLALCLGANLAIFAVIDSVLLRPLPFPDSARLVAVFNTYPKMNAGRAGSSIANYYERRGTLPAFSSLSLYGYSSVIVGEAAAVEREQAMRVSAEFFDTVGVRPALGRVFHDEEMNDAADLVVVLTDAYWREHFNADPGVLGRNIVIDGVAKTVVGVLPPSFRFLSSEARLFVPFATGSDQRVAARRHWGNGDELIGRLRLGATLSEAQAQLDAHNASLEKSSTVIADSGFRTTVISLRDDHVKSVKTILVLLQVAVLFLLLIGAVNLVNLLLIRASGRLKEMAIRQSMGANRGHVVKQVMVETVLLTLSGGVLGLFFGAWGIDLLQALGARQFPLGATIALNSRLGLIALFVSVGLGIIIAVPIIWFNLRGRRLAHALQAESRGGTTTRGAHRVRHGFIVAQIALAFVLLTGAGLLGLSLERAMAVSPGFQPDHLLTAHLALPFKHYQDDNARFAFADRLITTIEEQSGVIAAGAVTIAPLSGNGHVVVNTPAGVPRLGGQLSDAHQTYGVLGNYFKAMGYTLREGRFLTTDDSRRTERVCVVDADFARRYWPNASAIGQRVFQGQLPGPDKEAFTIVGVVGPVKQAGLTENEALGAVYYPYPFRANSDFFIVARTAVAPESMGTPLRSVLRGIDPNLPLDDLRTMNVRISESLVTRRSPALLAGIFAAVALLLAAIGTYGVLAYSVSQRRREIGVRMALGAEPSEVLAQFLRLGANLLLVGIALGALGSWAAGRALQHVLFSVGAMHPGVFAAAAGTMIAVVLFAVFLPSRRASRVSPLEALRDE